jgi:hypothetical protein
MTKPGLFHARHKKMELLPSALNPISRVAIDAAAFGLLVVEPPPKQNGRRQ